VPLAIWGVFGYTVMAMTAVHGLRRRSRVLAALLASLTGFALVVTVLLAAISHFRIHAWCLLCIGTYVVNLMAAIVSLRLLTKEGARASYAALLEQFEKDLGRTVAIAGLVGGAAFAVILLFPPTHASAVLVAPQSNDTTAAPEVSGAAPESSVHPIPPLPPGAHVEQGVTSDGLPWIGAEKPVVTVTEFFDYECSHCQQAFRGLHELLALNPDRLRLVVRHFPLDQACNRSMRSQVYEHSCSNAKLANCAREQHRFWEAHEYLFDHSGGSVEPATFAAELQINAKALRACLNRVDQALNRDIEAGIELDLHGTPVFVVGGKPYMQHLPQLVIEQLRRPVDGR
jgi:protein-disulfide isomerase